MYQHRDWLLVGKVARCTHWCPLLLPLNVGTRCSFRDVDVFGPSFVNSIYKFHVIAYHPPGSSLRIAAEIESMLRLYPDEQHTHVRVLFVQLRAYLVYFSKVSLTGVSVRVKQGIRTHSCVNMRALSSDSKVGGGVLAERQTLYLKRKS